MRLDARSILVLIICCPCFNFSPSQHIMHPTQAAEEAWKRRKSTRGGRALRSKGSAISQSLAAPSNFTVKGGPHHTSMQDSLCINIQWVDSRAFKLKLFTSTMQPILINPTPTHPIFKITISYCTCGHASQAG